MHCKVVRFGNRPRGDLLDEIYDMVIKVLIVEDSRIVRKVLNDMLRNVGQMSLLNECDSATGAIAALRRDPPDVILLDIQLSEGSGLEIL